MTVLLIGDCREQLRALPDNSVDSCASDPPYELGFMGRAWDRSGIAYDQEVWAEVLRVLKPGAHLAAFGGTRTYHRLACAIEDAGFEVRDQLAWIYGSGFPKSLDVSKALDKSEVRRAAVEAVEAAGLKLPGNSRHDWTVGEHAPGNKWWSEFQNWLPSLNDIERKRVEGEIVARVQKAAGWFTSKDIYEVRAPATEAAQQWSGWGTALKPSWEPICLARKPLSEKLVAANVLKWGAGALNIDGCRIAGTKPQVTQGIDSNPSSFNVTSERRVSGDPNEGRWPANLCHDGSEEVLAGFPETESNSGRPFNKAGVNEVYGKYGAIQSVGITDSGSAARFFYCAKAGKLDRLGSDHPTVKPVALMRWLVRLITPPGGVVLDPFAGTGSTGIAAIIERFDPVLIELRQEAADDIQRRLDYIAGLGRLKVLELAANDDDGAKAKARGHDLPLFGGAL